MNNLKKILNVEQIRATDIYSIKKYSISSLALMEKAARSFVNALRKQDLASKKILVICGAGNNGGDGFAVCRLLRDQRIDASAVLVKFRETLSKDCEVNKNKLQEITVLDASSPIPDFSDFDIIIDAIFGSGLNKPVEGFVARVIEAVNNSGREIYSIDVPSGLFCDTVSESEYIIKANLVISFQRPKLSFFFPENSAYVGSWEVVDIGLNETFIQQQKSTNFILDQDVSKYVIPRHRQSHKGTYGHALLMAGSYGKMGAAVLSAKACLRSGVGLLTAKVPKCGYQILQIAVPEAMCLTDEHLDFLTTLPELKNYNSLGIGPGIGKDALTLKMLKSLLATKLPPLVLDADAINLISENPALANMLPENTILTPHIKEFDRLVGISKSTPERFKKQKAFSKKHKCIIVLKDANTCISSPEGMRYFNTSGNHGMATGGSGDVLTGIITGLLAQKYKPLEAAIIGVYFHGKAGDQAVRHRSYSSLIASDIIEQLNIEHS